MLGGNNWSVLRAVQNRIIGEFLSILASPLVQSSDYRQTCNTLSEHHPRNFLDTLCIHLVLELSALLTDTHEVQMYAHALTHFKAPHFVGTL